MIVETRALSKQYGGKLAVDSLDLGVPEASISAFLGWAGRLLSQA
jgi:ABC-type multidrug transport system ATPase subunit